MSLGAEEPELGDIDIDTPLSAQQRTGFPLFLKHVALNSLWTFIYIVLASIIIVAFLSGVIESLIAVTGLLGLLIVILGGAWLILKILGQIRVWSSIMTYMWISLKTRKPYIRVTPTCPFLRGRPLRFVCFPVLSFDNSALDVCHNPSAWSSCQQSKVPEMIDILQQREHSLIFAQIKACRGLGMLGNTEGQAVLKEILLDEGRHINLRTTAAWALGSMNNEESAGILVQILNSKDPRLRKFSSDSLVTVGSPAIPKLIEFYQNKTELNSEENIEIRSKVLGILGKIGGTEALNVLLDATEDSDYVIKLSATYALGDTKREEAVSRLMELLHDPDLEIREAAQEALGNLKDIALKPLTEVLLDPSRGDGEKYDIANIISLIPPTVTWIFINELYNEQGQESAMELIEIMGRYDVKQIKLVRNAFLKQVAKEPALSKSLNEPPGTIERDAEESQ
ncbi:MAG: HEAT repeat domain-containing protein [Candidatus Hermodarchaeota archaeon]